jgi:hypothetical protein
MVVVQVCCRFSRMIRDSKEGVGAARKAPAKGNAAADSRKLRRFISDTRVAQAGMYRIP